MQTEGWHGPTEGSGKIYAERGGKPVSMEYSYNFSNGAFRGSIPLWDPDDADMGLTACLSRELPTRVAMLHWIFEKAKKLASGEYED